MPSDTRRLLCISLHDVAPATLDDCANTLGFLDDLDKVTKASHRGIPGRVRLLIEFIIAGVAVFLIVSRTGWSSELGYELYLQDESRGDELWEKIMAAGKPFGLKPGHTSSIRRIEGGMLSYHADADINTNP